MIGYSGLWKRFIEVREKQAVPKLLLSLLRLALLPLLWWKSRPSLVERALADREYKCVALCREGIARVGVVQFRGRLVRSAPEYAQTMYELVSRAVQGGAQLVVFPEDTGSYPFGGFIPGIERMAGRESADSRKERLVGGDSPMAFLLGLLVPVSRRVHRTTFAILARRFGVFIVAGSGVALDPAGLVCKIGYLYGPDGELIGTQPKTHLYPTEVIWGLGHGDDVRVFDTAVGRIAFPICMDHTFFEPIRIAWLKGAEIVIDPAADAEAYDFWAQARGVWSRVQESPAYGIACFMVGEMLGVSFGGRSGVYAPLDMTENGNGVIVQAQTGDGEEILFADLDLEKLREYRRKHPLKFNLALYRRYLPKVYGQYRESEIEGKRVMI